MKAEGEAGRRITVPLFPLPDVVLFPGQLLHLQIFEPRYRRMVEDALGGDRRVGMALLKPGWEADYEGSPAVHRTVGFGLIEHSVRLEDGRFNIQLRGEGKGRVEAEVQKVPYRKALLLTVEDRPPSPGLSGWVTRLADLMAELGGEPREKTPGDKGARSEEVGVELVNAVAADLAVSPEIKLELLELDDPSQRAQRVVALLEEALARQRTFDRFRPHGEWDRTNN